MGWVTGEPAAASCCLGEDSVPEVSPVLRAKCNREVTPSWGHPRAPVGLTQGINRDIEVSAGGPPAPNKPAHCSERLILQHPPGITHQTQPGR